MDYCRGRLLAVDYMRGIAIVLMLFQHAPLFLLRNVDSPYYWYAALVSRLSAPLFVLLAGYSVCLSAERRVPSHGRAAFLRHIMLRVAQLFALGCLVNLMRFDYVLTPNILHLMGLSVLVACLLYLGSNRTWYALVLGLLVSYSVSGPTYYSSVLVRSPQDLLPRLLLSGEYPPLPWLIYAVLGLGLAWFFRGADKRFNMVLLGEALLCLGLLMALMGFSADMTANHSTFMVLILGAISIAYYLVSNLAQLQKLSFIGRFMASYGRHSLAVYLTHQFLFITVPRLIGVQNTLDEVGVSFVFAGYLALAYIGIKVYEDKAG